MIALLIPCYNAEHFLSRLLDDARKQTSPFSEIVCYDDGSTDRTADVAEKFGCKVIRSSVNRGPSHGRNRLLAASAAPWVHFHDTDDCLRPGFVEAFNSQLSRHRAQNTAHFCAIRRKNPRYNWQEDLRYPHVGPETDWLGFHLTSFIHHDQIVFPRAALVQAGGYDERLVSGEDVNLHIRLAAAGLQFRYLDELLVEQNCDLTSGLGNRTAQARKLHDTLLSCIALRPLLPERYWPHLLATTSTLAVQFSTLQRRAEMETAIDETLALCPSRAVYQSRPVLRMVSRIIGFRHACRTRYRFVSARNLIGRILGRNVLPSNAS